MGEKITEFYSYEDDSQKRGSVSKIKNYYFLGALILVFILVFSVLFIGPKEEIITNNETSLVCGDGTFYSDCSLNRPYYCDGGKLIYDDSFCGCPKSLYKVGNKCESKYFQNEEETSLKYFLDGVEKKINFTVYEDVSDYLDTKERSIFYPNGENPRRSDFKFIKINDEIQKQGLMDLVVKIQNLAPDSVVDQVRIATSIVQNIPYNESRFISIGNFNPIKKRAARYPYQVIERNQGSCEGKSELLVLLLREMGYGTATFYYQKDNHEAVGIKCPVEESLEKSGYCFIETTVPSPISYSTGNYLIRNSPGGKLGNNPEIIVLSKGMSLPSGLIEYKDSKKIEEILSPGRTDIIDQKKLNTIYRKYGMKEI